MDRVTPSFPGDEVVNKVRRLRRELKQLDLENDSFVLVASDRGDGLGAQGELWEESIRVPWFLAPRK